LAGNIEMFSPERKEPSKPLLVALVRTEKFEADNDAVKGFKVSPNPFTSTVNVEFAIPKSAQVEIQLVSINGSIVYRNPAGILDAGHYILPLHPGNVAPGTYLVKIFYSNRTPITKKIVKG
jgi:hypothetical protein